MYWGKRNKILSLILCAVMSLSVVACSSQKNDSGNSGSQVANQTANQIENSISEDGSITVADFYSLVNSDWENEVTLTDWAVTCSVWDEAQTELTDAFCEIFEGDELDSLSEDDPMYKMKQYYLQLDDEEQRNVEAVNRIHEMSEHILSIKNIDELQVLMEDEYYSLFNKILDDRFEVSTSGNFVTTYYPSPLLEIYLPISDEDREIITTGYAKQLECLGYSEEQARDISEKAAVFDGQIHDYYDATEGYYGSYWENKFYSDYDCAIDIIQIQKTLGYAIVDTLSHKEYGFFAYDDYIDWLNKVITQDNLENVKAFYVVSLISTLCDVSSAEQSYQNVIMAGKLYGGEGDELDVDKSLSPAYPISLFDEGAVAAYYSKNCITDEQRQETLDIAQEIKDEYVKLVDGIEWLNVKQKERLTFKIKLVGVLISEYDEYNTLEDMEICDNVVDTTLSLLKSNRDYNLKYLYEGSDYIPRSGYTYVANAYYYSSENVIYIGATYFADKELWEEGTYETRLGAMGSVIAHEIGHGFDPSNIGLKRDGVYDSGWDDFWEKYNEIYGQVYYYYDGMQTRNGYTINGSMVINESFTDFLGMEIMMMVLKNHEGANYDEFFRSYAHSKASVMKPKYEQYILTYDTHVVPRERVNGVLAHIDEFYETYNVDTGSQFYIKPEDRIHLFQ